LFKKDVIIVALRKALKEIVDGEVTVETLDFEDGTYLITAFHNDSKNNKKIRISFDIIKK